MSPKFLLRKHNVAFVEVYVHSLLKVGDKSKSMEYFNDPHQERNAVFPVAKFNQHITTLH